ncbi:hypothetical protein RYX36_029903 [Vicia faba]
MRITTSSTCFLYQKESDFLHFAKYHDLRNDFFLVSSYSTMIPLIESHLCLSFDDISSEKAMQLCDRNFGVGVNGVICLACGLMGLIVQ